VSICGFAFLDAAVCEMLGNLAKAGLFALFVLSIAARETPLFLLSLALFAADGLSRVWGRYCLDGVEYHRRLDRRRATFGETVALEVEIVNRKLLPLAWLDATDELPIELPPAKVALDRSHHAGRAALTNTLALRPYERVRRRYSLPCLKRGEHVFGPARVRSGDLFGFLTRQADVADVESLVVLPPIVELGDLGLPARQPLGDLRTQSWLFEDASRLAGAREYRPGDSLRRIHWAATARSQSLQSRVYEATTSHRLAIFLDLAPSDEPWWMQGLDEATVELGITTAASVASWALERGCQIGLATNGSHRGSWEEVVLSPTADAHQAERIMLALGRLQGFAARDFAGLLAREGARLAFGTTVVVIGAGVSAEVAARLLALRSRGHPVAVLLTTDEPSGGNIAGLGGGITGRRVRAPEKANGVAR
jgi:uncharacterized protein (DUF58 family)